MNVSIENKKRVSIVLCTYNGEQFLREQLDSIINQSYPIYELIIQDDGSIDNTTSIISEYANRYPIIKCMQNIREHGVNSNFFSAMKKATGEYIAIADQDDIWMANKIEKQMKVIGDNLMCSHLSMPFPQTFFDMRKPNYNLLRLLFVGSSVPGHTILMRKDLLDLLPDLKIYQNIRFYDAILSMVAAAYESITFIEEPLVMHRVYTNSASYTKPLNYSKTLPNIFRHMKRDFNLYKELRPFIIERQTIHIEFLNCIKSDKQILKDSVYMLNLQISKSVIDFVKLQFFCMKHCTKLFYAMQQINLFTILRGAFFPISCSEYFRFMSKKY